MRSQPNLKSINLELFLLSVVSLYIELLAIRWMSADIRAFNIFRSFPLASCFIGLGVGFALGRDKWFRFTPGALLLFAALLRLADLAGFSNYGFPTATNFQWNFSTKLDSLPYVLEFSLGLFLLLSGPFSTCLCIGSRLGVLFNQLRPLPAYGINLGGALAGSIIFTILVFLGCPPWLLLIPCLPVLLIYVLRQIQFKWQKGVAAVLLTLVPLVAIEPPSDKLITYWSPYQRIDLSVFGLNDQFVLERPLFPDAPPDNTFLGLKLNVNKAFHQYFVRDDLTAAQLSTIPGLAPQLRHRAMDYALPYQLKKATDVLVVGAGTGQNISAALKSGALSVDGVEIDRQILKIGHQYNKSYDSPRVHITCDDARHFFNLCRKKYDIVNFSLLDSHSAVGQGSSVRIDSYVYTRESIEKALQLLKPDGLLVISFNAYMSWVADHLLSTVDSAAGYPPLVLLRTDRDRSEDPNLFFIVGQPVKNGQIILPRGWLQVPLITHTDPRVLTDDWPYLYVRSGIIDVPYLIVVGEILLISCLVCRRFLFSKPDAGSWQMFFLGAAFFLLELHAISLLSLVYGSTWLTSALVINGILLMILLANIMVMKFGPALNKKKEALYGVLLLSIFTSYFLPVNQLLSSTAQIANLGVFIVTLVTLLPMGVAGIIFAQAFSSTQDAARGLAFNLLGALVGCMLEYLAIYSGVRSLELVAACLYLGSLLCFLRLQKSPVT